ncbi:MAG: (d)CMP kinase [Sedimentisphaerales bacterium]|nr:(d)CMP kinase [Sedimentisphaerales bacterium]
MSKLVVTIDGPAASGKSTVARMLAEKLGAVFLDTGAMYRAVTLAALNVGVNLQDENELLNVLRETSFDFQPCDEGMKVFINNSDVTGQIRDTRVTENARYIASCPEVRKQLVEMQRHFASQHEKVVTEGRDQGTVAFAYADFKFYLKADIETRAKRRLKELESKGNISLEQLKQQMQSRDNSDSVRACSPLKKADDAIEIDTSNMTLDEVVQRLLEYIRK